MSQIAGFYNGRVPYEEYPKCAEILQKMGQIRRDKEQDHTSVFLSEFCKMANTGNELIRRKREEKNYVISMDGEIYNGKELRKELKMQGEIFETNKDAELFLAGYMRYGENYVQKINGVFAVALWDEAKETLFLFRDRVGVKPLFYMKKEDIFIYASVLKGILAYPGTEAVLNTEGLCEIFALGPAKTYGKGVFKDIFEVLPGYYLTIKNGTLKAHCYWKLKSRPHEESFEKTVEKTKWLLEDAVKKQMQSEIPVCSFLSGGVDSSLVTSICAEELKQQGWELNTFSFDFIENGKYFKANDFQPSQDRPWVEKMTEYLGTNHNFLECGNEELFSCLFNAVDARDLPCMADVESSILYFCSKVVSYNKVALTGECADEIFGGYPWFHKKEAFMRQAFPWSWDMNVRKTLLLDEVIHELPMEEYAFAAYEKTVKETPVLSGENEEEKRRREIAYLNLKWFMVTLLDRMDRAGRYCGMEARVPMADYRIVEYLWNVPWEMKCKDGIPKGLLRCVGEGKLPKEVLWRKKSPYPKTYHPGYERMLKEAIGEVMADTNAPVKLFLDKKKVEKFLESPSDYGKPWYGQLMAGPQMLAYVLQVNYWLKKYKIRIV